MSNNVTDRVILKEIYDAYYRNFSSFDIENPPRESKIYVPIDCHLIAKKLNIDADIVLVVFIITWTRNMDIYKLMASMLTYSRTQSAKINMRFTSLYYQPY